MPCMPCLLCDHNRFDKGPAVGWRLDNKKRHGQSAQGVHAEIPGHMTL